MDAQHARDRLAEEQDRLRGIKADLDEIKSESQDDSLQELSSYDQHQADVATETFEREKDLTILDQVEGELADVENALQRLDAGTYGVCEACGEPIGDDRLEALPATRFCLKDQAEAEREQRIEAPAEFEVEEAEA
jgi:RNA polymerase-binding transcription factor DksA